MAASPSPSPDAGISIGSVLDGRYRIDAVLGSGGMGRVYRGEHTGIGRAVAIKVLHADLNRNREAAQRFQREALASGRLDHPNIVGVSDFGVIDEGPCYLVMEALEGESLGERLERDKRIPWTDAIEILRGVLHGLRHAHDRGVVHRDIKPDNIFLARKDGDTIVKILDFGIAKLYAGSPDDPASTRAGLTVGTPAYLSPEQAVGGEIKPASDLYSSTILLFEMITGRPPFEDKDPLAMLGAHVSRTPPTITEVAPELDVPAALEDVIQRGLMKNQGERTSSAVEYLSLLDGVVGGRGSAPHSLGHAATGMAIETLGVAPTGALTPVPGSMHTPVPGSIETPAPGSMQTPAPGSMHTPPPGTLSPFTPVPGTVPVVAQTSVLSANRAASLADSAPVPRAWIKVGGIVVVLAIAGALLLALAGGDDAKPQPATPKSSKESAKEPPQASAPAMTIPSSLGAHRFDELVDTLENAKTCPQRKAAIPDLVALRDERAIPVLKKARRRMRGGVLGIGSSNANSCLKAEAEAAIRALGGSLK